MADPKHYDVLVIGGGPAGSTLGSLLKKYNSDLSVLIVEKEKFPREHVGESQLPPISAVLQEMGCWDKVEAAGFPIKIGATYTWGSTTEPWDFEFLDLKDIKEDEPRPAKYEGWRKDTAFQVERSLYDKILLDHAAELGCEVREETRADSLETDGDRVVSVALSTGETVTAKYCVDASGAWATLRRAMDVKVEAPTLLRNVAFWNYWDNAEWAEEIGVGATRVHIRSLPYGWIWFIPLGPTRTSIGVVVPASYYKDQKKTPAELYDIAVNEEPFVSELIKNATPESTVQSTKDWSFVVDRTFGENWFLVGETAGFADPILAAGLTLTQTGAKELAYTILELERGELDRTWLLERYDELQRNRVRQHHRFAEYWYTANGYFDRIREHCTEIAEEAGLSLDPEQAFRWLSTGGFGDDVPGQVGIGGLDITGVKQIMQRFSGQKASWTISGKNVFKLNLKGAEKQTIGKLQDGRIHPVPCYVRGARKLPLIGIQGLVVEALKKHSQADQFLNALRAALAQEFSPLHVELGVKHAVQTLEVMANDHWVQCSLRKGKPTLNLDTPDEGQIIKTHKDESPVGRKQASAYAHVSSEDEER